MTSPAPGSSEHPKRRRRRAVQSPIAAKFSVSEQYKGEVGYVSKDLFSKLFGRQSSAKGPEDECKYIAITPWQPIPSLTPEDTQWVMLRVREGDDTLEESSMVFPASPAALQAFIALLHARKQEIRGKSTIDVLVSDIEPLTLQSVFVRVDGEALRKHEEVQRKFGGGFMSADGAASGKSKAIPKSIVQSDKGVWDPDPELQVHLKEAIRQALSDAVVVHCNDQLLLPLPAHPITHVPFPAALVSVCEPVDQGLVSPNTKIVVEIDFGKSRRGRALNYPKKGSWSNKAGEESEDTTGEVFYSAAETEGKTDDAEGSPEVSQDETSATENSDLESDNVSDDSEDDMISLNSPTLGLQLSGVMSSKTAATPRPFSMKPSGIQTPGSIFSSNTATTARQGMYKGKQFNLKPLISKVPDSILHPKPGPEEDDEARIYVDIRVLVKLGCFSGDWVRLTVGSASEDSDRLWPLGAFGDETAEDNFRIAKIYGIPDVPDSIQYPKTEHARQMSQRAFFPMPRNTPNAYASPILAANLGQPSTVRIAPLLMPQANKRFSKSKLPGTAFPPVAKEVTITKMLTLITTEKGTQMGLLANLKQYFEQRRRVLRAGDLIAISLDAGLSRIITESSSGTEIDPNLEDVLVRPLPGSPRPSQNKSVAWFKVNQITSNIKDGESGIDQDLWGGAITIEPMTTRMVQAGSGLGRVPPSLSIPWEYYLGVKKCPRNLANSTSPLKVLDQNQKPYVSQTRRRVRALLAAGTSAKAVQYNLEPIVILLHSTQRSIGKAYTAELSCADLGLHLFTVDGYEILSEGSGGGDVKTEATLRARLERSLSCGAENTVPMIRHIEALTADRIHSTIREFLNDLRVLILTSTDIDKVTESIRSLVTHEIEVSAPDEGERNGILGEIVNERAAKTSYDVDLGDVAVKTAALVAGDLVDVVDRALVSRQKRLEEMSNQDVNVLLRDILLSGGNAARCVTKADFELAVDAARRNFADSIGAPKIPNVSWDDVGGLTNVKDAVMETIQLPLERPELFAKGMKKRSGILFYGPPGTGKTLLAKAIATEFSLNFFSVKGPELLNMYIGESEANVRRVFQRARDARPCVVFFDELDSVAPKRGNQGDSGGVMDRIVSQLLAELDGMSNSDGGAGGVFVIGATNRPDLLDQALLRPGRFDKMLYLGVSDTHDKQLTILEALTRKFTLSPQLSLKRVSERLPFTYTGADLYALSSDAMLKAITRQANAVDEKIKALPDGTVSTAYFFDHYAKKEDIEVMVTEEDFREAQVELVPSISAKELDHYQRVRETFEGPPKAQQPASGTANGSARSGNNYLKPSSAHGQGGPNGRLSQNAKGKARAETANSDDSEDEEDDDDAYVTSNDYSNSPAANGSADSSRKHSRSGFGDAAADDESELYG